MASKAGDGRRMSDCAKPVRMVAAAREVGEDRSADALCRFGEGIAASEAKRTVR